MPVTPLQTFRREAVRGIFGRMEVVPLTHHCAIALRFRAVVHALCARGMVSVVVILVDGQNHWRGINHGGLGRGRMPQQPVVPPSAADSDRNELAPPPLAGAEMGNSICRT